MHHAPSAAQEKRAADAFSDVNCFVGIVVIKNWAQVNITNDCAVHVDWGCGEKEVAAVVLRFGPIGE